MTQVPDPTWGQCTRPVRMYDWGGLGKHSTSIVTFADWRQSTLVSAEAGGR